MTSFVAWQQLLLIIPALLVGFTIHEYMHARVALALGDPTARNAGRVTFNPIKHLDPIGTIVLVVTSLQFGVGFGWAKPVPVDERRLQNPRVGGVLVSLAGPAGNLLVAVAVGLFIKYFGQPSDLGTFSVWGAVWMVVLLNLVLMFFNLIPIPPLDGSRILPLFLPGRYLSKWYRFEQYGMLVLIGVLLLVPWLIWEPIRFGVGFVLGLIGLAGLFA